MYKIIKRYFKNNKYMLLLYRGKIYERKIK